MNTTALTMMKTLLEEGPQDTSSLMGKLDIKNWQLNSQIKYLTTNDYVEKKGKVVKLQENVKTAQLRNVAKKFAIEKILHESNELILSYLSEPIEINALVLVSGLSKATIYRAISDLESIGAIKKEGDTISIYNDKDSLSLFAKYLKSERELRSDEHKVEQLEDNVTDHKLTFDELKNHLWAAADILRGSIDANEYRQPIMTILFLKRLNDRFEEKAEELEQKLKNKKDAWEDPDRHSFFVPIEARWKEIINTFENIGEKIDNICTVLERTNLQLTGILTNISYNDKKRYPDDILLELVTHFGKKRLRNSDLENEDIFGQAYEYLLEQFADSAGKKAGEFFTPREVVRLMVEILEPSENMKICDPTCGSGGMLIWSRKYIEKHNQNSKNVTLHGQERNYGNYGMCKMNMILHGIENFRIENENVLTTPLLVEGGKLIKYDRVIANFPFSMDWDNSKGAKDPYNRFSFGIPLSKGKADFAFIQHMYSTLNENGKAAIICSQGILFRGNEEENIRKNMVESNVIEAIIALPANLFYGTGIPACILILNKNKPESRKNKILFIYAANDYQEGKSRDKLRDSDIEKILSAYRKFEDIDKYCYVSEIDELKENEFNLNVPRYVDISEPEEEIDIQETVDELKELEREGDEFESKMKVDLKELGIKV